MSPQLRVLDLFAGCGGLSKGLEKADFTIVAANEFWDPAAATHRKNHPYATLVEGDITLAETQRQVLAACGSGVDVLVGGPPCQAYSLSGRRDAKDPRAHLFADYLNLVASLQPTALAMENVKGLLSMTIDREGLSERDSAALARLRAQLDLLPDKYTRGASDQAALVAGRRAASEIRGAIKEFQEPVADVIIRRFEELGYRVRCEVLNAADFGVPQRRERVIFLGVRKGHGAPQFASPTHSALPQQTFFGAATRPHRTVREAIDDLKNRPEDERLHHILPVHSPRFLAKLRATRIGASVFASYEDAFYRCPPDEPARTVKENHNGVFVHYEQDRVMTPRELARLQDFDDEFLFIGKKSVVLKQIGNAVPVGLGKAIGESIRVSLAAEVRNAPAKAIA
jgi:DNA (cytosine-5)-methyltransferase 1